MQLLACLGDVQAWMVAFQEVVVPARCAAFLRANAYELWEAPLCFCWSLLQPGLWDGQACDWLRAGDA